MVVIRRIYVYLLALVGLSMLCAGVANLGRIVVEVLAGAPAGNTANYVREGVAGWGAAALVGLPAWVIHWLWAQRLAANSRDERTSELRRLFVYVVLAGAAIAIASAAHDALNGVLELVDRDSRVALVQTIAALPRALVASVAWVFYWRVAAGDRTAAGEQGGSATLRRWYVYGLALGGFVSMLVGVRSLVQTLWALAAGGAASGVVALTAGVPGALVGLGLWLFHWHTAPRLMGPGIQADDSRSTLRSVYLFLALSLGVSGALAGASQLLYYGLARLLGVARPGGVGGGLLEAASGPGSVALVYAAAWAYQRFAIHQDAQTAEAPRQVGVRRFYTYLVALLALAALSVGAAGLLWTLGDALTNAVRTAGADWWRERVALYATLVLVGLPVWLAHWRPVGQLSAEEPRALTRRLYTYLALIGGALALVASAAGTLFRLLTLALGEPATASLTADLAHALGVAVVAATLAVYHWRVIRADTRRASAEPLPDRAVPGEETALVRLRAANAQTLEDGLGWLRENGIAVEQVGR